MFSKDEEGAIPADEIKWSIFAWTSKITLSKVCNSAMFVMDLFDSLIWCACLCRFVLMHLPGIKVKVSWSFLFLRNDSTSQESESKSCPQCQIFKRNEDGTHYSCKKWKWRSLDPVCQEIEEMIITVDKNQDGKISYSEFRVRWTCSNFHFTSKVWFV